MEICLFVVYIGFDDVLLFVSYCLKQFGCKESACYLHVTV